MGPHMDAHGNAHGGRAHSAEALALPVVPDVLSLHRLRKEAQAW